MKNGKPHVRDVTQRTGTFKPGRTGINNLTGIGWRDDRNELKTVVGYGIEKVYMSNPL